MHGESTVATVLLDLERTLGDPHEPSNPLSFAEALDHDDREAYPAEGIARLVRHGLAAHEIPAAHGGSAVDIVDSLELFRAVARRDASVATSMATTSLAYMPVWVAGTDEQRTRWAGEVCTGTQFSWALSEQEHGSDIMATATTARRVPGGWVVDGRKWPIGNASRSRFVAVFARTGERRGPAAFTILMVDRHAAAPGSVRAEPSERFHGVRAIDNGGLVFDGCFVPDRDVVGGEGHGLEIALRAAYPSRILASSVALGCADTALRLTVRFARERVLFGRPLTASPYTARDLARSYAEVLAADAVVVSAARSLQVCPQRAGLVAAITKFFVPTSLERTTSRLAGVLGARHFMRSSGVYGMFGKCQRDLWISHFAEGNHVVNLKNVALGLGTLLPANRAALATDASDAVHDADGVFGHATDLPPFEPWRFAVTPRGADHAVVAVPDAIDRLRTLASGPDPDLLRDRLVALGERLLVEHEKLAAARDALESERGPGHLQSPALYDLAGRYCAVHAAACVLQFAARPDPEGFNALGEPALAALALHRLLDPDHDGAGSDGLVDEVSDLLLRRHDRGRMFTVRGFAVAESDGRAQTCTPR